MERLAGIVDFTACNRFEFCSVVPRIHPLREGDQVFAVSVFNGIYSPLTWCTYLIPPVPWTFAVRLTART